MDANAAARNAARQRWAEKDFRYRSESIKFWNRESQAIKGINLATTGFSRSISDDYTKALWSQGQAFKALEQGYAAYFRGNKETAKSLEAGRSRTAGRRDLVRLLHARGKLEAGIENEFGANMQRKFVARKRQYQGALAQTKQALGVRPEYGAPVMMPPSDRLSGALSIASQIASLGTSFGGSEFWKDLFNPNSSDIRLKERIKQVGVSPQGYKIYEFNYKGEDKRWRGAMAQDVVKKNPMAVGIRDNYLTVDYNQIDVNMEPV